MPENPIEPNPYAPPEADLAESSVFDPELDAEAAAIRKRYLTHEASVKSIGSLWDIAALLIGIGLTITVVVWIAESVRGGPGFSLILFLPFLAFFIAMGRGLKKLKPWAKWVTVVLAVLTIVYEFVALALIFLSGPNAIAFGIVFGVLWPIISGYVLYLLLSKKGNYIFTDEYRRIIEITPEIKYKSNCLSLLVLAIIIGALIAALFALMG